MYRFLVGTFNCDSFFAINKKLSIQIKSLAQIFVAHFSKHFCSKGLHYAFSPEARRIMKI